MAKGFNKVILMGNLTRDPETRAIPSGQNVTNFSLAVNRTWKNQDGETQEAVNFIDCVAWGRTGETIAQYMQKGRPILVEGRLEQRSWEDKESGQKRSKIEVTVESFNFVGGGSSEQTSGPEVSSGKSGSKKNNNNDDEVVIEDIDDKPIDLSDIPF